MGNDVSTEFPIAPPAVENNAAHRERPRCPFYGFTGMGRFLVDSKGNGCGLMIGHCPCKMEMNGEKPDWYCCSYSDNTRWRPGQFETLLDTLRIFPDELHPADLPQWDGVSLRGWFHLIVYRTPI